MTDEEWEELMKKTRPETERRLDLSMILVTSLCLGLVAVGLWVLLSASVEILGG
jgi:hypothetical protein